MNVTFYGAAQEVTGSMHLLELDGKTIALDCGMFQGRRSETQSKNATFPFPASSIHAVVLSHAHIDHTGRLPLLVKQGFTGQIFSTSATRDLCALMLADAAHIQEEDARFLNKKNNRKGEPPVNPLFNADDAAQALKLFHTVAEDSEFWVNKHLTAKFRQTGHMLGSAFMELRYTASESAKPITLVFTGDVGRFNLPILKDPVPFPICDYLITESTYGGRQHPPTTDLKAELADIVHQTIQRGGRIIIPAFSVGRTQVIVYFLHQLQIEGQIPKLPIYVDSPLAVDATEVFRMHPELFDTDAGTFQKQTGDILGASCCTYIRDVEESKRINTREGPCIIISASGMCENGRILHHLKNNVENPKNTVLIVGFQAEHTLGRRLVEKQKEVKIFGQDYKLRAQVISLQGFSGHADAVELMRLLQPLAANCKTAFLVHGEMDQMQLLRNRMSAGGFRKIEIPAPGQRFELDGN